MTIDPKKILQFLISLFVFTIPFQIKDIIFQSDVLFGKFSPYLTFEIYFQDIIFGIILILSAALLAKNELKIKLDSKSLNFNISIFLILYLLVHSLILGPDIMSFLHLFRLMEMFFVFVILQSDLINKDELKVIFIITMILQFFIAVFQFIGQQSVGFSFLGESVLNQDTLNVAKVDLHGIKYIRSYGTFPHPNILAAAFVLCIYFCITFYKKFKVLNFFLILLFISGLFLTLSRASIISLAISLIAYYLIEGKGKRENGKEDVNRNLLLILILFIVAGISLIFNFDLIKERFAFTDLNTISERMSQIQISLMMIKDNFFGVGIGNFVIEMQKYTSDLLSPWLMQPVHNLLLLMSSELGIIFGLTVLFLFLSNLYKFYKSKNIYTFSLLLFIFLVSNFDHFFYDIYSGQLLLVFALSECFSNKELI